MSEYVAVLTAAAGVSDDIVKSYLSRNPGWAERLSATAVRVDHPCRPSAMSPGIAFDINILPAHLKTPKLFLADMDSTMIGVECIDELADYAGVKPDVAAITERAMQGELDFEGALTARVALLEGLPVSMLETCYEERVHLNPGARTLVEGMNAAGARTVLVSGGFTFFSTRVAAAAGFHEHHANMLEERDGRLTGRVIPPILGRQAKAERLATVCASLGVAPDRAVAIGDGANDLAMIRAAGIGVAYRAKPALKSEADAVLDYSDLSAVLALCGLPVPN